MKIYIIGIVFVLYSGSLIFGTWGYIIRNETEAIFDHYEDQAEKVTEVKEKIIYRDKIVTKKIEVIKHVKDPTGCLDTPVPDDIDEQLYQIYNLAKQS